MSNIDERIENFKADLSDLRKEVKDIKETLSLQNELILNLLTPQTKTPMQAVIEERKYTLPKPIDIDTILDVSKRFPLSNMEHLNDFESEINDENKMLFVNSIRRLMLPDGICRNIARVLSYNIIMNCNTSGRHYKTNLSNFPKVMDVLYLASYTDHTYTHIKFLCELKRSLRLAQNRRHTKNSSIKRKSLRDEPTQESSRKNLKTSLVVRTQEIFFPPLS